MRPCMLYIVDVVPVAFIFIDKHANVCIAKTAILLA